MSECMCCFKDTSKKWKRLSVCINCKNIARNSKRQSSLNREFRYYLQCVRQINMNEKEKSDLRFNALQKEHAKQNGNNKRNDHESK